MRKRATKPPINARAQNHNTGLMQNWMNQIYPGGRYLYLVFILIMGVLSAQERTPNNLEQMQDLQQEQYVPPFQARVQGTALEGILALEDYPVGPGDRFILSIMTVEPYLEIVTVSPSGMIIIPAIGTLTVSGLTAAETIEQILELVQQHLPKYEAICTLYGIREIRVSVTGAVRRPGLYSMTPVSRLSDLFQIAGGLYPSAALHKIELRRGSVEPIMLEYNKYFFEGMLSQNLLLRGGDAIFVPYGDITEDYIIVGGLAPTSRYYPVKSGENLASIMNRTNFGDGADLGSVTIKRAREAEAEQEIHLRAEDYRTFTVQPGDVLYIDRIPQVSIVGEIYRPGLYNYQPSMTVGEYIVLAGGITKDGSARKAVITDAEGKVRRGLHVIANPGDSIFVPRSFNSVFLGQLGVIQAALTFLNIYLAYLAATRVSGS